MWWMIFNQTAFCRGGGPRICTGTDLTNTEAEPALVWAAEHQVRPEVPVSLKAALQVTRRHRPTDSTVWRSSQGLIGTLHTMLDAE